LLPWDLDNTLERFDDEPDGEYPTNPDPVVWEKPTTRGRPWYDLALTDPMWFEVYIGLIDEIVHSGYETEQLHGWIDEMTLQIEDAVVTDVNKPYSNETYFAKVEELYEFVEGRHEWLEEWLGCWQVAALSDLVACCIVCSG